METCRCVGIPSRFVSGYQFMEQPPDKYELHAWTEVFCLVLDGEALTQVVPELLIIIILLWLLPQGLN